MNKRTTAVKGLGEIALRVNDLGKMEKFYGEVIGLEEYKRFTTAVFFRIADGYKGHPQALIIFDRSAEATETQIHNSTPNGVSQDRSTLDHIALEIDLGDYESEYNRLNQLGLTVKTKTYDWGWRSLYTYDPEGNTVEFVCFDDRIIKSE